MPRAFIVAFCLCAGLAQAEPQQADLAYSLGARLGERLHDEVPDLPLDSLLEGLRQAYENKPLRLSGARIEQILDEHEARMAADPQRHVQAAAAEQQFLATERSKANVREIDGGVLITELRAGTGPRPSARSHVQVRYIGQLADGRTFDESQSAQWFRLDSLIAGWRQALLQMPVGAHWRLVVPSAQAYGVEGAGDLIPAYAPLVFDLELLGVKN